MKIALYIEDGLEQIVLTPETETEKGIVGKLHDANRTLAVHRGSFYACHGGWVRQQSIPIHHAAYGVAQDDESTILVMRQPA